jgi:hypothetical protein
VFQYQNKEDNNKVFAVPKQDIMEECRECGDKAPRLPVLDLRLK